jgi:hypothetical protein
MKFLSLSFLLLFLVSSGLFGQADFRPGFIINLNNDTVRGWIDYRGNFANSRLCLFKPDPESGEVRYLPDKIKAYRFTDSKYYVSKKVKTSDQEELIFVEFLLDGIVDVYYYRDESGENFLLDTGDGKLLLLKDEKNLVKIDHATYESDVKRYAGIMKYAFRASPAVCREVETLTLSQNSVIKVAREYHEEICKDRECIVFEKKVQKTKLYIGPIIGLNLNYLTINKGSAVTPYYFEGCSFNPAIYPSLGAIFKVNLSNLNERTFFQYETSLGKRAFHASQNSFVYFDDSIVYLFNDIRFHQYVLNNSISLRYEFPVGTVRPVFQLGGYMNNYIHTVYNRHLKVVGFSGLEQDFPDSPFGNVEYGASCGVGSNFRFTENRLLYIEFVYRRGLRLKSDIYENNFVINLSLPFGI